MKKTLMTLGIASCIIATSANAAIDKSHPYRHTTHQPDMSIVAGVGFYDLDGLSSEEGYFAKFKHGKEGQFGVEVDIEGFSIDNTSLDFVQYRLAANYEFAMPEYELYVRPSIGAVYTDYDFDDETGVSAEVAVGNGTWVKDMVFEASVRYDDIRGASLNDELRVALEANYFIEDDVFAQAYWEDTGFSKTVYVGVGVKF